jgi:hypothetical protein
MSKFSQLIFTNYLGVFKNLKLFKNQKISFSNKKFFSDKNNDNKEILDIKISQNKKNIEELEITIPRDLQPFYSFGTLGHLPLYENPQILGNFRVFMPAPKINITIFSIYTYLSYGTALFQPSLLLTLFVLNKMFMSNYGKLTQILLLSLEKNCEKLYVKTLMAEYRFNIADTKLNKTPINVGNAKYYELKNKKLKFSLFISSNGVLLHKDILHALLNGDNAKVNLISDS